MIYALIQTARLNDADPPQVPFDESSLITDDVLVFCPGNSLTKSGEFLEDGVSCSGPHEGL